MASARTCYRERLQLPVVRKFPPTRRSGSCSNPAGEQPVAEALHTDGKVRVLCAEQLARVLDKRASPFALSEHAFDAPSTGYHHTPKGLCPFPSAEDLGIVAVRMDPFPVHDEVGAAAADDTADVGLPFDIGPF
jgi:hypothetical protein